MVDQPQDAIRSALQLVAAELANDGFAFVPSRPKFVRRSGDLSFEVHFQSSRWNTTGHIATVVASIGIFSKIYTRWCRQHSSEWIRPKAPFPLPFLGAHLGYVRNPREWIDWDFADPRMRAQRAAELTSEIRAAYPIFAVAERGFPTLEDIMLCLEHSPEGMIEYLLASGRSETATLAFDRYLDTVPGLRKDFEKHRAKFARNGLPDSRGGPFRDLAAFAVAAGYPWAGG
jgi:hypothetical protein